MKKGAKRKERVASSLSYAHRGSLTSPPAGVLGPAVLPRGDAAAGVSRDPVLAGPVAGSVVWVEFKEGGWQLLRREETEDFFSKKKNKTSFSLP